MDDHTDATDPIAAVVRELCPELDDDGRKQAEENLRRYLAVVVRVAERIAREEQERDGGGSPQVDQDGQSGLPEIVW